ncbi:MAG: FAD-dependent thymidylate synthase [Candidatus Moranbacteria bacterium]|nr:FAD-dependent thymidylate synthase [Candidatus Moranbacteria bacterium]
MDLSDLIHVTHELPNGGMVLVLNTGAVITPEAEAMIQALHSRSVDGILGHLEILKKKGPEKFMSNFYVGYGHKSIGDCGSATVFVEGVSMLTAKAIQDWRLYNGQESSTRYIPFGERTFLNPANSKAGEDIQERWRSFYVDNMETVVASLFKRFPKGADEKDSDYEKAIRARAFDIMRGFLPAGATTNVAWRMELRQFADELMVLRHHPIDEVRLTALETEATLQEAYPSSFGHKHYDATETYNREWMSRSYYFNPDHIDDFGLTWNGIDPRHIDEYREVLENRPPKTELPQFVAGAGTVGFEFLLDFGSFRDLQRHRSIVQRMPLLSTRFGFGSWYLEELPPDIREKALDFLPKQQAMINLIGLPKEFRQYYIAMGYQVPCSLSGDLRALTYIIELRGTRFVHPTLRKRVFQMKSALERILPSGCAVFHMDPDPDRFDAKRGTHDIIRKD